MHEQKPTAFLFPGQGSQFRGMGEDVIRKSKTAYDIFKKADQILPFSVSKLCLEDPFNELQGAGSKTSKIQPALFTVSVATSRYLQEMGVNNPVVMAGHSLGGYSAREESGALDFETALRIVAQRGKIMEQIKQEINVKPGIILGATRAVIESKLSDLGEKVFSVRVTIENTAKQIMVCGFPEQLEILFNALKNEARKYWIYQDAPPSHHPFLENAQIRLNLILDQTRDAFRKPLVPVLDDVTGNLIQTASETVDSLKHHLIYPLNWKLVIQKIGELNIKHAVEIGPGNILKGIVNQIDKGIEVLTSSDLIQIEDVIQRFGTRNYQA